ncbi:MAG: CRISPR-associated endonuclease Cas2 [Chlorobi bacterium]|nr:CRISPR-associated endonuclease Cas2 [Chlorobiota bacterium]
MSNFIIVVYDVHQKRVAKVLKTCRKYLHWVQNSVFEGEITPANLQRLIDELNSIIDPEYDSIIIYFFRRKAYTERRILGQEKGGENYFI